MKTDILNTISDETPSSKKENENSDGREASWPSVLFYLHLCVLGIYGIYVLFTDASLLTIAFSSFLIFLGVLGATTGAHRLWAHKTYTATAGLKVFLMLCQTLAGQGSIYRWVQVHRLHHQKFRQNEDPCYSAKDFISAQVHAQILNYTPEQEVLLNGIDMTDLIEDKVVMFQKKYYWILFGLLHVLLPINAPVEYWNDSFPAAVFVAFSLRYFIVINMCWLINSSHFVWGLDRNFKPSDSNSIFFITKSYWPQYHYLLTQDYLSGEFGDYSNGVMTAMIRVYAALDLASDLKTISSIAVRDGLTTSVETGRSIVECIEEEAKLEMEKMPKNHFLNREKFL